MKTQTKVLLLGAVAFACVQMTASALDFGLNSEFSGGSSPSGPIPWANVSIQDDGAGVLVTLHIDGSSDIGKLTEWYINFDPTHDAGKLQVAGVDTAAVGSWKSDESVTRYKADGDGTYSVRLTFAKSGNVFKAGEDLTFRITSTEQVGGSTLDLDPSYFDYLSVGGARGSFHTAAHVQSLSGGSSGWVGDSSTPNYDGGVPDGSFTLTLLGMAAVGLEIFRRRFGKTAPQE